MPKSENASGIDIGEGQYVPWTSEPDENIPWFTVIIEPKQGDIGCLSVQAGDADAAHDTAIDKIIDQLDIPSEKIESINIIGVFEGNHSPVYWN